MSVAHSIKPEVEPIVIYRRTNSDGATFSMEPMSVQRLRKKFHQALHTRGRIFLAHETHAEKDSLFADIIPQLVQLLTGLTAERLAEACGEVIFRDAVTDEELRPKPRKKQRFPARL